MSKPKFFPVSCPRCGWIGFSKDAEGGNPMADTWDVSELLCPSCLNCEGIETVLREVPGKSEPINEVAT